MFNLVINLVMGQPKKDKTIPKDELIKKSIEIIKSDESVVFIDDIIAQLPISKQTFYNKALDQVDEIKNLLELNKINKKRDLRKKWETSRSPALQLALYKLLATSDEFDRLQMQKIDHTSRGESLKNINIIVDSADTREEFQKLLDGSPDNTSIS